MSLSTARAVLFSLCILFLGVSLAHADTSVNINTADAQTLAERLSGVGAARAEAIVEYREANGPFESVDDLMNISGIGTATVEANRESIVLE